MTVPRIICQSVNLEPKRFHCNITVPNICFHLIYPSKTSFAASRFILVDFYVFICTQPILLKQISCLPPSFLYLQRHLEHFGTCVLSIRQLEFAAIVNTHISGLFLSKQTYRYTFGPFANKERFPASNLTSVKSVLKGEMEQLLAKSACWLNE